MKKLSFLFIVLVLLNSCATNNCKNIRGIFCSSGDNKYVFKLDSNNVFEIEIIILNVGIQHYYCKGEYSYTSMNKIIIECDSMPDLDRSTILKLGGEPAVWNPYSHKEYIKLVSNKEVVLFNEYYKKVILRYEWCDCIPNEYIIKKDSTFSQLSP